MIITVIYFRNIFTGMQWENPDTFERVVLTARKFSERKLEQTMTISLSTIRCNLPTEEVLFSFTKPLFRVFFPVVTKYNGLFLRQKRLILLFKETAGGAALLEN